MAYTTATSAHARQSPGTAAAPPGRWIARHALAAVRPGGILTFHDGYDDVGASRHATVDAVERLADALLAQGVRLGGVPELLGLPAYDDDPLLQPIPQRSPD